MKTIIAIVLALSLSGCSWLGFGPKSIYVVNGIEYETTEQMAYLMAVENTNKNRDTAFALAISKTDRPDQVVALTAALFGKTGQMIERPKEWDERLLPWMSVLNPWLLAYTSGNRTGGDGINIKGTGNTVVTSKDYMSQSNKYNNTTPSTSQTYYIQAGTDGSNNGTGSWTPNNSDDHSTGN